MFRPSFKPKSGSGSAAFGPVSEVEIGTFLSFQESGKWTAEDARNHLDGNDAPYAFDQVYADLILIGGGGPGTVNRDYSSGIFGGFPGSVVRRRILLSEIFTEADSELMILIGIGGRKYDAEGGTTIVETYDAAFKPIFRLTAFGGSAGANVQVLSDPNIGLAMQSFLHETAAILGYRGHDLSSFVRTFGYRNIYIPGPVGFNNVDGPGIGGSVLPTHQSSGGDYPYRSPGGDSNCFSPSVRHGGVPEVEAMPIPALQKDGEDADPTVFDSFGAGGGVGEYDPSNPNYSGVGGQGGRGGGGGGACFFNGTDTEFQAVAGQLEPGHGGNGEFRIRLFVLRSAS
ncbi:hypothetical protein [uncultured Agrobacterium sp.]|uniref:hypothetical protein n=1 Tax=uncultured Agrobacterium sp. TaxID=157277 RepID=UPI0025E83450|nr:hypothetical protein [uncultured Agrobacterium sp.]